MSELTEAGREAQRILDGEARRLLRERLQGDAETPGATAGSDVDALDDGADEGETR